MKIAIASDHAARRVKQAVCEFLTRSGHEVLDLGTDRDDVAVDYPDFAEAVALRVASGETPLGVLLCGTGIGMTIAANKFPRVRAALVHDTFTAAMARKHNDANVLVLGGRLHAPEFACEMVRVWLSEAFEPRHRSRLDKISAIETRLGGKAAP